MASFVERLASFTALSIILVFNKILINDAQVIVAPKSLSNVAKRSNMFLILPINESKVNFILSCDKKWKEIFANNSFLPLDETLIEWNVKGELLSHCQHYVWMKIVYENHSRTVRMPIRSERLSVFFQSDKNIYRPGETVRFRVLLLDSKLSPISDDSCHLAIENENGLKLESRKLHIVPPKFFAEHSFPLSNAMLDEKKKIWSGHLKCQNHHIDETLSFRIEQYESPLFLIEIQSPAIHRCSEKNLSLSLNVTYTHGKVVRGNAYFKLVLAGQHQMHIWKTTSMACLNQYGGLQETIQTDQLCQSLKNSSLPARLIVEAIVTDLSTNIEEKARINRTIVCQKPYLISLEHISKVYKPKVSNYFMFKVVNLHGEPVPYLPVKFQVYDKNTRNIYSSILSFNQTDDGPLLTDNQGRVVFSFRLNHTIGLLTVKVESEDANLDQSEQITDQFELKPFDEHAKAFLSISNKTRFEYQAGEKFSSLVTYHGSVDLNSLFVFVTSKSTLLHWHKIDSQTMRFQINITNRMMPSAQFILVGFHSTDTKTFLADQFWIQVTQKQCGPRIELTEKTIYPGENAILQMEGYEGDVVAFSAIDEIFMKMHDKLPSAAERFKKILFQQDSFEHHLDSSLKILLQSQSFAWISFSDEKRLKRSSSLECSNKKIRKHSCCKLSKSQFKKNLFCGEKRDLLEKYVRRKSFPDGSLCVSIFFKCCLCFKQHIQLSNVHRTIEPALESEIFSKTISPLSAERPASFQNDALSTMIRYDFRESWLFDLVLLKTKKQNHSVQAPHSITKWLISTQSLSEKDGFCFNQDQLLKTYKPFFIHVSMPLSIVLHEQAEILVTVFDYLHKNQKIAVDVELFSQKQELCLQVSEKRIFIEESDFSGSTAFPIIGLKAGTFLLKIKASTWDDLTKSDTIEKNFSIVLPGIVKEETTFLELDPANRARRETLVRDFYQTNQITSQVFPENFYQKIEIQLNQIKENVVPGSMKRILSMVGKFFNPSIKCCTELSRLMQRTQSGAEQNMFCMAYNFYVLHYLKKQFNQTIISKAKKYLRQAWRQQIAFKMADNGAFKAFYGDGEPSTWLTAFTIRIFCQSTLFIDQKIDQKPIIIKALEWLLIQQSADGWWEERNQSFLKDRVLLSAHLLIAFHKCRVWSNKVNEVDLSINLKKAIDKTEVYLIDRLSIGINDSHALSIVLYSLSCSNESMFDKHQVANCLTGLKSHADIRRHQNQLYYWNSFSIETSSYVLLLLSKLDQNPQTQLNISNWLWSKQKREAVFENSQDTLVAMEALLEYQSKTKVPRSILEPSFRLEANVSFDEKEKKSILLTEGNMDFLYTLKVDHNTRKIDIETSGNGLGRMQLFTQYNTYQPSLNCYFDLKVDVAQTHTLHYTSPNFDESLFFNQDLQKELFIEEFTPNDTWSQDKSTCSTRPEKAANNEVNVSSKQMNWISERCLSELSEEAKIPIENAIMQVLQICLKRFTDDAVAEMVVVEVSLLSGYRVVEKDLHKLQGSQFSKLAHYHVSNAKVTLYLKNVSLNQATCLCFRIYQQHLVDYIESALIQVYDYFNKESSCSLLYNGAQIDLNLQCRNETMCKCVINKKCPSNQIIQKIYQIYQKSSAEEAFAKYKQVLCSHQMVLVGVIVGIASTGNTTTVKLSIQPERFLHGNLKSKNLLQVRLDSECWLPEIEKSGNILLMMEEFTHSASSSPLMIDSRSILMWIDPIQNVIEDLNEMFFNSPKCQ